LLLRHYSGGKAFHWLRTGCVASKFQRYRLWTISALIFLMYILRAQWFGLAKVAQMVLSLPLSLTLPLTGILIAHAWRIFVSYGASRASD